MSERAAGETEPRIIDRFEHDDSGRLVRWFKDRDGRTSSKPELAYTWDEENRPVSETDGETTKRFEYDSSGRFTTTGTRFDTIPPAA